MFSSWIRNYSSKSSNRDNFQKTLHQVSKLQFGPVLKSRPADRRQVTERPGEDQYWPREEDTSQDYWMSTIKSINSNTDQIGPKHHVKELKKQTSTKSKSKGKKVKSNVVAPTATDESSILRIPFTKPRSPGWASVSTVLRETMSAESRYKIIA